MLKISLYRPKKNAGVDDQYRYGGYISVNERTTNFITYKKTCSIFLLLVCSFLKNKTTKQTKASLSAELLCNMIRSGQI